MFIKFKSVKSFAFHSQLNCELTYRNEDITQRRVHALYKGIISRTWMHIFWGERLETVSYLVFYFYNTFSILD